jgi:hypothetical protein
MKALLASALIVALLTVSCGKSEPQQYAAAPSVPSAAASRPASAPSATDIPAVPKAAPRKLIRELDLRLTVSDIHSASTQAQETAARAGGYLSSSRMTSASPPRGVELVLRVPVEQFDLVVKVLRGLGTQVRHEDMKSLDVTDQFVDLEARRKALAQTEQEIGKLLEEARQRGLKINDILSLHNELTQIRSRIEQLQGQMNLLENQAALSTIRLTLSEAETVVALAPAGWSPMATVHRSGRALMKTLQVAADTVLVVVILVLPLTLMVLLPMLLARLAWKRMRVVIQRMSGHV